MAHGVIFTIGHSTRSVAELVQLLQQQGVQLLVDIRTSPKSKQNPQFNKESISVELPSQGLGYRWLGRELGGLRSRNKSSELNAGWDNPAFRGYADYMQTPAFRAGVQQLTSLAEAQPVAIMCAEAVYWQCHRALLCDALVARGWEMQHIIQKDKPPYPHKVTKFAKIQGEEVTYPPGEHSTAGEGATAGGSRGKRGPAADNKQPKIDAFFKRQAAQKRPQPEAPS